MSAAILRTCGPQLSTMSITSSALEEDVEHVFAWTDSDIPKGHTVWIAWISYVTADGDLPSEHVRLDLIDPRNDEVAMTLFDDDAAGTTKWVTANNDGEGYVLPRHGNRAIPWKVRFTVSKALDVDVTMTVCFAYIRLGDDRPWWSKAIGRVLGLFGHKWEDPASGHAGRGVREAD